MLRSHIWIVFRGRAPNRQDCSFGPTSLSCAFCNSVYGRRERVISRSFIPFYSGLSFELSFAENKLVSLLIIETLKAVSIGTYVCACIVCITCFRCCPENPQRPRRLLNSQYQAYFCLRFSLTKSECYATFLSCTTDSNYGTDR